MKARISWWWELCFAVLALLSAMPLWLVEFPPIQDLPQHLAAIRVLHSYHDPGFGLEPFFRIELFRTQYLTYYLAAHLLAYPFGVVLANKLLLTAALFATPYAMRALLGQLGRDQRLALFVFPLTYNAHLILGFFNFLAAIPLALYGLALAIRQRKEPRLARAVAWALLALLTFCTHVVPFGFLALGAVLLGVGRELRATVWRLLPLLPAGLGAALWMLNSPAGQATITAASIATASGQTMGPRPQFQHWRVALRDVPRWLTDVLRTDLDQKLLLAWAVLAVAVICLALGTRAFEHARQFDGGRVPGNALPRNGIADASLQRRMAWLAPLAAIAYFVMPVSYDWIWPIAQRFPLLAAIFLVAMLPCPKRMAGALPLLAAAVAVVSAVHFYDIATAFRSFDRDEVGELDAALGAIPPRRRVAGLIWSRGSAHVLFSPFIHSVAYYQVKRGGAVMFTFADFPQSPFAFREDNRPPRVAPRWEWKPERVDPARDLAWYDYVLVRGGPGRIARQTHTYRLIFRSPRWSVWKRMHQARD